MKSSISRKKSYSAIVAMGIAAVFIATMLPELCKSSQDKPPQRNSVLLLNNSVIVQSGPDTDTVETNAQSSQIAATHARTPFNAAIIDDEASQWRTVRMRVTAYCPCSRCCGPLAEGRTANGHVIRRGDRFVAAPKRLSFGTEVIVPQYNGGQPIKVLDRGGAIYGTRLDIFFPSHAKAIKWGVKCLDVKVRTE